MRLFSFIKDAGAKILGIGKTEAEEAVDEAAEAAVIRGAISYCKKW